MAQRVKNLSAVQETGVQSLVQKDPLEKGMATHSSILAWRIEWERLEISSRTREHFMLFAGKIL